MGFGRRWPMQSAALRYSVYAACAFLTGAVTRMFTAGAATDPDGDPDGAALEALPVAYSVALACVLLVGVELCTLWFIRRRKQHAHLN
jgi:formate/nitrite transporter FocA (FNT family)